VSRSLALVAFVGLVACLGVGIAAATTNPQPAPLRAEQPNVLMWGGSVFFSQREFEPWLARHHETYAGWATLHPIGQNILGGANREPPRFHPWQLAPAGEATVAPVPAGAGSGGGGRAGPFLLVLAGLALSLITLAFLPARRLAPYSGAFAVLHERRVGVSAAGIGILVGVAVARLAG
jgi:hypothetical protein